MAMTDRKGAGTLVQEMGEFHSGAQERFGDDNEDGLDASASNNFDRYQMERMGKPSSSTTQPSNGLGIGLTGV